eukprot:15464743-Alexandrium_andersonii.AAC.1
MAPSKSSAGSSRACPIVTVPGTPPRANSARAPRRPPPLRPSQPATNSKATRLCWEIGTARSGTRQATAAPAGRELPSGWVLGSTGAQALPPT